MDDKYFEWLLKKIEPEGLENFNYYELCKWLFERPFIWSIRNDANRAADGIALRKDYIQSGKKISQSLMSRQCSVFEMLVALSVRVDNDILGDPTVYNGHILFWVMIENLGLDVYDDPFFDPEAVDEILDIWLKRRFREDGSGSIFCVKNCVRNQKKIEIWFQMCDFLNENYGYSW